MATAMLNVVETICLGGTIFFSLSLVVFK